MPHNDYTAPGGKWATVVAPLPKVLRRLDEYASQMVNGDAGGTWTPASPIVIGNGGAGGGLYPNSAGSVLSKGAVTGKRALSGGALILGTGDVPIYTSGRSRTIVIPIEDLARGPNTSYATEDDSVLGGMRLIGTSNFAAMILPGYRLHAGAILQAISVTWRANTTPATLVGLKMPNISLAKVLPATPGVGGTFLSLEPPQKWTANTPVTTGCILGPTVPNGFGYMCTTAGTTHPTTQPTFPVIIGNTVNDNGVVWTCQGTTLNGTFAPKPSTLDAYRNAGSVQSFATVPHSAPTVDATKNYWLVIANGSGSNIDNTFHAISVTMSVPDMTPNVGF